MDYRFQQVDVFSKQPCMGNPVAVFLESQGLSTENMQRIARWTNLSETTFVSESKKADYRVRIFTPTHELPFAGHPTLGTAWALKKSGVIQKEHFVQECDFGLIQIFCEGDQVFFELPHFKTQELQLEQELREILAVAVRNTQLITTGPRWLTAELLDADSLYKLNMDLSPLAKVFQSINADGLVMYGIHPDKTVHLRAFFEGSAGIIEDPVCGSGNAAVAAHIMTTGNIDRAGLEYEAFQGAALKRDGRISVILGDKIRVGGQCNTVFEGNASI